MIKSFINTSPAAPTRDASPYVSRDQVLSHLSPPDAALVCAAEAGASVGSGEEYLDLHHLDRGVRKASALALQIGNVLPKCAVGDHVWTQILQLIPGRPLQ